MRVRSAFERRHRLPARLSLAPQKIVVVFEPLALELAALGRKLARQPHFVVRVGPAHEFREGRVRFLVAAQRSHRRRKLAQECDVGKFVFGHFGKRARFLESRERHLRPPQQVCRLGAIDQREQHFFAAGVGA